LLPANAQVQLAAIAETLKADAAAQLDISGYADATGDAAQNEELAKERAKAVREALTAGGIAEERINMQKPEVITSTGTKEEARRVEVSLAQ
jgi:cytochrome c oxidase subunit 2